MNSLSFTPLSTAPFCSSESSLLLSKRKLLLPWHNHPFSDFHQKRRIRNGKCKAELSHEAPFVIAMGACMLNSLVLPVPTGPNDDEDGDSVIDSADARFAVMGIISFIPYFNWMSWVFAWMDTGKRRYVVYALVYLAPYLRSNLSLSPEESWLPIASILLCIIHIQVEASIKNGDLQFFQLFKEVLSNSSLKKDVTSPHQGRREDGKNLPHAHDESRKEIKRWGVPTEPGQEPGHLNKEGDEEEKSHDM